jgi:antitoxin component of MazEF toxin-antitoxin module
MPRQKAGEEKIRKIIKLGAGSYAITLPIKLVREFKWREKQKVTVRKHGDKIIIEDWKEKGSK